MALTDHALTLVATAKAELGIAAADTSRDAIVERQINAVSDSIRQAAGGRTFHRTTTLVERYAGNGQNRLVTRRAPIVSVTQIRLLDIDGTVLETLDSDYYQIEDADAGILYRAGGFPWLPAYGVGIELGPLPGTERQGVEVTYRAGWITPYQESAAYPGGSLGTRDLPYDLEEACLQSVVALFQGRSRDRTIASKSTEQVSVTFADPAANASPGLGLLTEQARSVARRYWRSGGIV